MNQLQTILSLPVLKRPSAFMGFDGFIDTIARLAHGASENFNSMSSFGTFLLNQQERNCSVEAIGSTRKIGGNLPICANALAIMGVPVACVGAMGVGHAEPIFSSINSLCSIYPVAMPGECLAIEFKDSRLYVADMTGPKMLSWEGILKTIGLKKLRELAGSADLLGLFNWGELPNIHPVLEGFARDILPGFHGKCHTAFFDLSDCSGRSENDIKSLLSIFKSFQRYLRVVLSANDNEIYTIASALGYDGHDLEKAAARIYESGTMDALVHHSLYYARVFDSKGVDKVPGIYVDNPVFVTGGGDHFNAGLCLGLIAGFEIKDCAVLGNTVSRLYVSTGNSPLLSDVVNELMNHENDIQKEDRV